MISTMVITMDAAGRPVIPSQIRREAGIEPDTPLDVRWRDGIIEIEPQPLAVKIERKGRLLVATPRPKGSWPREFRRQRRSSMQTDAQTAMQSQC